MKTSRQLLSLLVPALVVCAACANDPSPPDDLEPPSDELLAPPAAGTGIQLATGVAVSPGVEITYCQYFVLPAGETLNVQRFESVYTPGSHHLLLFATGLSAADVADDLGSWDCASRGDAFGLQSFSSGGGLIYAAQEPASQLVYPDGVAAELGSEQVVMLQTHYLNTSDDELQAQVRLNIRFAEAPPSQYAGTMFFYNWAFAVPPASTASAFMTCEIPQDVNLLFAGSHMHKRGTHFRGELWDDSMRVPELLYETTQWENADPARWEPSYRVRAGQRIEFACDFMNDRNQMVPAGSSAETNEMCIFFAAYYPRTNDFSADNCFGEGSGPMRYGDKTCGETLACAQQAEGDRDVATACMAQTCEASSMPFNAMFSCMIDHCGVGCLGGGGDCATCALQNCGEQFASCNQATCD